MKKSLSLGLIMILVVGVSVLAFAHGGGYGNNGGEDYYRDELNLSADQLNKMEDIENKYYEKVDNIIDDLREQNYKLRDLYFDKDSTRAKIIKMQNKINQLQDNLFELRTEMYLDLRQILTANQLERMEDNGFMGFGHMMFGGNGSFGHHGGHMNGHRMMYEHGMMGW
ncbi:Spy/CpxP family protein refolding chaperone [Sporohalobacter salinus]|uniref:Spy/CpxP family protein refolding chaperone n=1 Tax=Sporohalobacter salinus TaxID=1494606 RepID=UPI00195F923E|nr:periplasmic heavy metal sensor [Sporohalobacter salinus]MBM7624706.1 Spy/CpxP family protein refolding chaperone [Sporohalobacter salinus]